MTAPVATIWDSEPHTRAKHAVLRAYLEAWFPILSTHHGKLVYLDGFAGPGRYSDGEEGSPVIALKVALTHRAALRSELSFLFVERHEERADWLAKREIPALKLPRHFEVTVRQGEFASVLREALDELDKQHLDMAPTFAFIDPFGITGLPMSLILRLLKRTRCETLITFMSSTVRRFVTELPEQVNKLIGDALAADRIARSRDRVVEARVLYERSLRRAARFVRFFQLRDTSGEPIYDLFFASNHPKGHEKMKEAMWKVDGSGAYSFSDGLDPNQQTLFSPTPGADLAQSLWEHFNGKAAHTEEIFRYVSDTAYLEKHARDALRQLEDAPATAAVRAEVDGRKHDGTKRRAGSFPPGVLVRFSG